MSINHKSSNIYSYVALSSVLLSLSTKNVVTSKLSGTSITAGDRQQCNYRLLSILSRGEKVDRPSKTSTVT